MKDMGWDYWTYRRQPVWIIRDLVRANAAEALAHKHSNKG